jgi:hypothetical protein
MYFFFRWMLICFKREFSFEDVMHLWEVRETIESVLEILFDNFRSYGQIIYVQILNYWFVWLF